MNTFTENVLQDLKNKDFTFSELIFILPSKRAGVFLKSRLQNYISETSFAPEIVSIEDFVQDLAQLRQISGVELLFEFYSSYKKIIPHNRIESFDTFSKRAFLSASLRPAIRPNKSSIKFFEDCLPGASYRLSGVTLK